MEGKGTSPMQERKAPSPDTPSEQASETWKHIPWRKLERHCFRIQKRIFQASQQGNQRAVHKLQKLLMRIPGGPYLSRSAGDSGQPGQEDGGH
jgi:RNA-directed DNA polymerase